MLNGTLMIEVFREGVQVIAAAFEFNNRKN